MEENFRVKSGAAPRLIPQECMLMERANMAFVELIVTPQYHWHPS